MRTVHRALSAALFVGAATLAGIAAAGCETDDSSSPLPPATKDATADQASSDGAPSGGDSAPHPESSTMEASSGDGGGSDGAGE